MKLCGEAPKSCRGRTRWSNSTVLAGISIYYKAEKDQLGKQDQSWELTPIDNTKLFGVRAPCEIMDRTFLVKSDSTIKVASGAQKIHSSLAVITLVRVVNFSLG